MKKIFIYIVLGFLIVISIVFAIRYLSNPLRKSEDKIRENILRLTPIGTNMEDVITIIQGDKKFGNVNISNEWGVVYDKRLGRPTHYANFSEELADNFEIIGEKCINVSVGHYSSLFAEIFVRAWWAFDENGELIDVIIEKDGNGF